MCAELYNVRMHAESGGDHVSGAERMVPAGRVEAVTFELLQRAIDAGSSAISLKVEAVSGPDLVRGALPDLHDVQCGSVAEAREQAVQLLVASGVAPDAAEKALQTIASGASSSGQVMRGAMLVDAATGERLEPDSDRGVRATCFDIDDAAAARLEALLSAAGLHHRRTREALVLASKVLAAPGVVAELCWSDDPGYRSGYVSSAGHGYVRLTPMKEAGDPMGGRAFFVRPGADVEQLVNFLEKQPYLVTEPGRVRQG